MPARSHGETVGARGLARQPAEYQIWAAMKQRCGNPANKDYPDYGARGITVCKRWLKYENFLADMGRRPSTEHSLDRKKNHLGYCKGNCHWVTHTEQTRNARSNILVEVGERKVCLAEAAEIFGVEYHALWWRVRKNKMPLDAAVKDLQNG